jgi:phage/plasmid-associated DNA primase
MLLAQNYREDVRVIVDYVSGKEHHNSAYSTFEYNTEYQYWKRKYDGSNDEGSENSNMSGELYTFWEIYMSPNGRFWKLKFPKSDNSLN